MQCTVSLSDWIQKHELIDQVWFKRLWPSCHKQVETRVKNWKFLLLAQNSEKEKEIISFWSKKLESWWLWVQKLCLKLYHFKNQFQLISVSVLFSVFSIKTSCTLQTPHKGCISRDFRGEFTKIDIGSVSDLPENLGGWVQFRRLEFRHPSIQFTNCIS